jgi:hypothetical protein
MKGYFNDGADNQAQAVRAFLGDFEIEASWNDIHSEYEANIRTGRWENCREQGYVLSLLNKDRVQLNIAFFGHRNSDSIHAVKWEQNTLNSPNIDNAKFGGVYKDKFDTSFNVRYGEIRKMAEWIEDELEKHWNDCQ